MGQTLLFARDAARSTPEVAAGGVAETSERLLSKWEPGLGPIWGVDVHNSPAIDAHQGTEEYIRTVNRDRCVIDCADTGIHVDWKLLGAPRHFWDASVGPHELEGSHSADPDDPPNEPASPPHSPTLQTVLILREWWGLLRTLVCQRGWGSWVRIRGCMHMREQRLAQGEWRCWINRCTRQCYRCVQHLHLLPTIHHRSRSSGWNQRPAHACGMHDSHAPHNTPS